MLRIERFLTLAVSGRSNESVESCLKKTISIHDDIVDSMENTGTYVTVDIGKYGSGIMQKEGVVSQFGKGSIESITTSVESIFHHLFDTPLTLEKWENTFVNATNGIVERGYIAMLQQNIASQADCLILMGGGSFQQVAGIQYLNNRGRRSLCLHTVCVSKSFKKTFSMN